MVFMSLQSCTPGKKVTTIIDGSKSTGYKLANSWRALNGSGITIQNSGSMKTTVTITQKGQYPIELLVKDSSGQKSKDTMIINVNK